jgi:hypothetical protein
MPDGARFLPVPGSLAESHFGLGMIRAADVRRRGFSPEKFLEVGYLKAVPSYA